MSSNQDLRILCLEDVPADAELEERALRDAGMTFTMQRVDTRESFVAHLETFKPDLIIADYRLPDIDGLTAVRIVRERQPELPIILCTGVLDDVAAVEIVKAGANDYVRKDGLPRLPIAVKHALREATELKARHQAEQALREAAAEVEDLYNLAPCGYHSLDRDGLVTAMNDTELLWLGYRRDEVVGKKRLPELLSPASAVEFETSFPAFKTSGQLRDVEVEFARRDGTLLPTLVSATAITDANGNYVKSRTTVYDISSLRGAQHSLAVNIGILKAEHDVSPDGILVVDADAKVISYNRRFMEMWSLPLQVLEKGDDRPLLETVLARVADPQSFNARVQFLYQNRNERARDEVPLNDGRVFDRYSGPMMREDGSYIGRVWYFHDITERKQAARALEQLNRMLRTVNAGNELLVRASNETELLEGMCRVVVEVRGYLMAWIGFAEHDAAKTVRPAASVGHDPSYSEGTHISWGDHARGLGPTGSAIRTGQPQVSQDIANDARMLPWRDAALAHGFAASASFPLHGPQGVFGAFTIYASAVDAFVEDDVRLLIELSNDLAFGILALRDRVARRENEKRLKWAMEATVQALANTVEQRDPYTAGHQRRVAELAAAIARATGLSDDEIEGIYLAGMIHDIGKVQVPAEILSKPGPLSKLEYQLVQEHPRVGFDIVRGVEFPWPIAPMILQHHERMDGSGYPKGLQGDAILPGARILAVADVVEAMTARRPYREALGLDAALKEIEQGKGRLYDPKVADTCIRLFRDREFAFEDDHGRLR